MVSSIRFLLLRVRTEWFRFQIDACSRQLSSIAAQRANDFEAERIIHGDLCVLRAELQKFTENCREARFGRAPSSLEDFRPRLARFKKSGTETD